MLADEQTVCVRESRGIGLRERRADRVSQAFAMLMGCQKLAPPRFAVDAWTPSPIVRKWSTLVESVPRSKIGSRHPSAWM